MKFYDKDGIELDLKQFEPGQVVVARVTKEMSHKEFSNFCKDQEHIFDIFRENQISLVFCPDWIEFKGWD